MWDTNVKELGEYVSKIISALKASEDIRMALFGSKLNSPDFDLQSEYANVLMDCLYVDGIQTEAKTYICVDADMSNLDSNIKDIKITIQIFSDKSLMKYTHKGHIGNRPTIISQMVEEILVGDKDYARNFGIGRLNLKRIGIFTNGKNYYGRVLTFTVPNFR